MDERARRARSFGAVAEAYDRVRPGYPAEAVDWLLPEGARRVVDIGAGTGLLTRSLVGRGLEVVAVEPDPKMRAVLSARLPEVDAQAGSAEEIPLENGSADAIVGGQMWHWVDVGRGGAEAARVLRSGGVLGLTWNLRDTRVEWMAELGEIFGGDDQHGRPPEVMLPEGASFEDAERAEFPSFQKLSPDDLVDFVDSRSHVQVLPEGERADLLERVDEFARTHPLLAGRETIEVPYVTTCWRAVRS